MTSDYFDTARRTVGCCCCPSFTVNLNRVQISAWGEPLGNATRVIVCRVEMRVLFRDTRRLLCIGNRAESLVLSTLRTGNQQATCASVIVLASFMVVPWLIDRAETNRFPLRGNSDPRLSLRDIRVQTSKQSTSSIMRNDYISLHSRRNKYYLR